MLGSPPRAPVVAAGLVLAGHGVDSARSPTRPTTTVWVSRTWLIDTGAAAARVGAAAGETDRGRGGGEPGARAHRHRGDGEAPRGGGGQPGGSGGDDGRPQRAAVARGGRGVQQGQLVVAAPAPGAGPRSVASAAPRASRRRAQVTRHRRGTGERTAQPTLLGDVVGADLAGDEVAVPRPLAVHGEAAGGVLRQLLTLALHPHGVGHTTPAAGRRMMPARLLVGVVVVEGCGARCASDSRSWARPRWMRERTVPSLMPRVAATSS